jgi:hypothetical protein
MNMTPGLRKFGLSVHVTSSVGWLGAIAAYLALNAVALTSQDEQSVRAAYLMMEPVAWFAIVPLAVRSLVTGIVQSLGTSWGLFRRYWVLLSFVITVVATAVLLLHLPDVSRMADLAADPDVDVSGLGGDLTHSVGGLLVLLAPLVLNIYKPRGMTRYGQRKQRGQRSRTRHVRQA